MKELFRRGLLLFLSLALLIWCTGCAPESAEGTGSLSSSPEEGKALFQLDPEKVLHISLTWSDRCIIRKLVKREDIEKVVEIFNQYQYRSSKILLTEPASGSGFPYHIWFSILSGWPSTDLSCSFFDNGSVLLSSAPAAGATTVYMNDQAGYFDEVISYFSQSPSALASEPAE